MFYIDGVGEMVYILTHFILYTIQGNVLGVFLCEGFGFVFVVVVLFWLCCAWLAGY